MSVLDDLLAASTDGEILHHVARGEWAKAHDGAECPPARIPTPDAIAEWVPQCPPDEVREARARLGAVLGDGAEWLVEGELIAAPPPRTPPPLPPPRAGRRDADPAGPIVEEAIPAGNGGRLPGWRVSQSLMPVDALHSAWAGMPDDKRPPHPIAPMMRAWQQRPVPAAPFVPVKRASLPRLARMGTDEARLPDFPVRDAPAAGGQLLLDLPGIGDVVHGCASCLLWLFDRSGGRSLAAGHGAPWDLAMFVFALLHLDVADRDGSWRTLEVATLEEHAKRVQDATGRPFPSAEAWLFGEKGWTNRRRDWHNLPEALERMTRLAYLPIPGIGRVAVLFPSVIPAAPSDPLIQFTIRVPKAAATGDRLNWPRLTEYRRDSARLFRAYLAVTAWLGRSARSGHPLTRTVAAPVLGPDGQPRRRRGGGIIRSATERIDNPTMRYAGPPLSERDLTRMIGFDPSDRYRRRDARAAFDRMAADGVIDIDRSDGGYLIYGGPGVVSPVSMRARLALQILTSAQ